MSLVGCLIKNQGFKLIKFSKLAGFSLVLACLTVIWPVQLLAQASGPAQAQQTKMANSLAAVLGSYTNGGTTGSPALKTLYGYAHAGAASLLPQHILGVQMRVYSYAGLYNILKLAAKDTNNAGLAALMYFGDGSGVNSGSTAVAPSYGQPGPFSLLPSTPPMASFFQTSGTFEAQGGILQKTSALCTALDAAYGTAGQAGSGWLGATCVSDQDCCPNADGTVVCVSQASMAMPDPNKAGSQISYGICDVPACVKVNNNCNGSGAGNCCQTPVALTCDSSVCKLPVGATCTVGQHECATGTQCDSNSNSCKITTGNACYPAGSGANCLSGYCDSSSGKCELAPDGNSCTASTQCLSGNCSGGTCQCVNPSSCTTPGVSGGCCNGYTCAIPAGGSGSCVQSGKNLIPTGASGCANSPDCVVGDVCTQGVCQCAPSASCSTTSCAKDSDCDSACCAGMASCDLTTNSCVLNTTGIPAGDDCYSDGVNPLVAGSQVYPASICKTGYTCQAAADGTPRNFCQACISAPSSLQSQECLDTSNCCFYGPGPYNSSSPRLSCSSNSMCTYPTGGGPCTAGTDCTSGTCNGSTCA